MAVLAVLFACLLVFAVARSSASTSASYPNALFTDGFESGSLSAWDGNTGNGSATVIAGAAHTGSYGLRLTTTSSQYDVINKKLASPLTDSSTSFWVRASNTSGIQTLAEARDSGSSATMWAMLYDGSQHAFWFYPYRGTTSTEIFTGAGSAPANTWIKVEVQYTATATGGAALYINGQTQAAWSTSGDYTRTTNYQKLQLWTDGANTTDFDDVTIATPAAVQTAPGAPTGVTGSAADSSVALSWTAPASDGGSAITGYRVTPYIGSTAQTAVNTGSNATGYTVTGLTNGTAYTFTVAATNGIGTGPDSAASSSITPSGTPTAPGSPTAVTGSAADKSVVLSWTAPGSSGGSPITSYRVTPYIGSTAQTAINTGSNATTYTVTGLTNGTAYTFKVAATNAIGTGADSTASAAITPTAGYGNAVFADGFESGSLSAWNGYGGTGSGTVVTAAAHSGNYGLRLNNASGQYGLITKVLTSPLADSSTSFWVRFGSGTGIRTLAQARDSASSATMWALLYDGSQHALWFYPYRGTTSTEIFTGAGSAPANTWIKVEVQYTATSTGGARLLINGQTQAAWSASGDYTRTTNYQKLQLWDDAADTSDFDDVTIATPSSGQTLPAAPTAVVGTAGDGSATLSWTAPTSDGGSAITSYRITPYIGAIAQTPTTTGTTATSYTVTGLTNGTAYTFTVAASNGVGAGPDSAPSAVITPSAAAQNPPGPPTSLTGTPASQSVILAWTAPTSDGGSPITSYRVTPYIGSTAQTAINTGSNATTYTVTGLTNGTAYTFTVAATNANGTGPESTPTIALTPANLNPIQVENSYPGDPSWGDFAEPSSPTVLSGYGSRISVNHGQPIDFYVTTTAATVKIDVFRMGWYGGIGARLMQSLGTFPGVNQPQANPDTTYGMVSENWSKTATLTVPSNWTSGVYLARLLLPNGTTGAFIFFVVRDDGGTEPILFQTSTNTYQAYNAYGGTSLYNNNTDHSIWAPPHAMKVSYDRPFLNGNGAGQFLSYEYPMVRWLEKQGYNVGYTTDVDTDSGASSLTAHKAFLVVGHDEYWSKAMRDNVEGAIAHGVNVGFFAGNESYWQVRYEANASGVPDRVMVGYKDFADCSCPPGPDPMWNVNNSVLTSTWRNPLTDRPEEQMMGVQFGGETNNSPYIVTNASNWVFTGTGWSNGTSIPGIVGYEYDHYFGDDDTPENITVLSNTPLTNTENNQPDTANSTLYTAPSGAMVFAAGTIQWGWGLDNFGGNTFVNAGIQQVTTNILAAFTGLWSPPVSQTGPGAPTSVVAAPGDGSVTLHWNAPASNGGSPITGYRITPYNDGPATGPPPTGGDGDDGGPPANAEPPILTGSTATSYTITGLTNGTAYTFTVAAINATGIGPASTASSPVTPGPGSAVVPSTPTGLTAAPADKSATLSWTAPASDGGTAITSYRITPYIGTTAQTAVNTGSNATTYTVTGLSNGTTYTFTVAATNAVGTGPDSAASAAVTPTAGSSGYSNTVFSDGFESGSLSAWNGNGGNGSATVVAGAARTGNYGLRLTNTSGQFDVISKNLTSALTDSSVSFWVRVGSSGGVQTLAEARDSASSATMWAILYDGGQKGLWFYPFRGSSSTEIFTGANTVPLNTWVKIEVQYTATATGGVRLYINGQTQPAWSLTGNYTRSTNFQRLLLWDDVVNTTDIDDVTIATP